MDPCSVFLLKLKQLSLLEVTAAFTVLSLLVIPASRCCTPTPTPRGQVNRGPSSTDYGITNSIWRPCRHSIAVSSPVVLIGRNGSFFSLSCVCITSVGSKYGLLLRKSRQFLGIPIKNGLIS
ncbi:hypothetical protein DFS33DRAFT_226881 [Desarmillaria ectypa]|nr:hypothetical protein DFS33DRAFT_226881 [Desarmillaria ectypa]